MEQNMNFAIYGQVKRIEADNATQLYIEVEDATIAQEDEKYVVKTFSDETLIEEVSRRGMTIVKNTLKRQKR